MAEETRNTFRGLLLPDSRLVEWDAHASYTTAGPRPGVPVPQQDSTATLRSSGTQSAAKDLRVRTARGGFPDADNGASFVWRNDGDTYWRGWDVPSSIQGFEQVRYVSGNLKWAKNPHAITLGDGTVLCATAVRDDTSAATKYRIEVDVRSPTTGTWTTRTVQTSSTAPTTDEHPCLLLLPSGRILCYFAIYDSALGTANVRCYRSDTDGATWILHEPACLATDISTSTYTLGRIRAAYANGTVLMVVLAFQSGATTKVLQYASKDLGSKYDLVETLDSGALEVAATTTVFAKGCRIELVSAGSTFVFLFVDGTSINPFRSRRISNAYTALSTAPALNTGFGAVPPISPGLAVEPDGTLWFYCFMYANTGSGLFAIDGVIARSVDLGRTWVQVGQSSRMVDRYTRWWMSNLGGMATGEPHPSSLTATVSQGRILLACNHVSSATTADYSLSCLYLGGWTDVGLPGYGRFPSDVRRTSWETTWLPFDRPPVATVWAAATVGSPAVMALDSLGGTITSGAGEARYYHRTPPGTYLEPITLRAVVAVTSGGDLSRDDIAIRVRLDDTSSNAFEVSIRMSTAGIRVWDHLAGSQIGSDVVANLEANGVELLFSMVGGTTGKCSLWWRLRTLAPDRPWQRGPIDQGVSNGAAGAGSKISWGHVLGGGSGARTTVWREFHDVSDEWSGQGLAEGQQNPADLFGHPHSGGGAYVDDGVFAHLDGTTARADEWAIETRYDYELARALPATLRPSPRISHRSTSTAAQTYAFQISGQASGIEDTHQESDLLGVALYGTNWPQVTISGYDVDTTSWVTLATVDLSEGLAGLVYNRKGSTVRAASSGASSPPYQQEALFEADECHGWRFWAPSVSRRIGHHLGGKWSQSTHRQVVFPLEDVSGADPSSGGDGRIVPDSVAIVIPLNGARYSGWRLEVPAPSATIPAPVESYYEVGYIAIGPVFAFADEYSWGRTIDLEPGSETVDLRDRTSRSRVVAPSRRTVAFGWTDAVDLTASSSLTGNSSPDYILGGTDASAEPVAAPTTTPYDLAGIARRLDGAHWPIVYLPAWSKLTGSTPAILNRRGRHLLGRLTSPVAIESVQGDESEDEVVRVAQITIEEVI